ncbi:MAG TPA: hypothetical protein VHD32_16075 [Candidatus Didemnitutus sp.]|nr:hypothetical protein [Candidatus Didemnitutus sp.]
MKTTLILFVLFCGSVLVAESKNGTAEMARYRSEFISKLGISKASFEETGIWQFDVEKAVTKKGIDVVYDFALHATDTCTGERYFRIGRKEEYIFVEKCYPLEKDLREVRLYFFVDKSGVFVKVGCSEAISQ